MDTVNSGAIAAFDEGNRNYELARRSSWVQRAEPSGAVSEEGAKEQRHLQS